MIIYQIKQSTAFKKDVARAKKRGLDLQKLNAIVGMLATGQRLPAACRDHALKGKYEKTGDRECHIAPDWLLIYRKNENMVELRLVRTGTHRELNIGG